MAESGVKKFDVTVVIGMGEPGQLQWRKGVTREEAHEAVGALKQAIVERALIPIPSKHADTEMILNASAIIQIIVRPESWRLAAVRSSQTVIG